MAEPTPGRPGGSAGPRSATAATFVVNDSSLRSLHGVFELLIKDIGRLNSAIISLNKGNATLDQLHDKLAGLGVGRGGSAVSGSGSRATNGVQQSTTTRTGDGRAPNGGDSKTSAQLGRGGRGDEAGAELNRLQQFARSKPGIAIGGAIGAYAAAGSYYRRNMGDISDLDLMYNQAGMQGPGGYSRGNFQRARQFLTTDNGRGIGGYQSAQDLAGGVSAITGALGGGVLNQRTQGVLTSAGALAALNPAAGLTGSANAAASLYNPATAQRLRSIGASPSGSRGQVQTPAQIYQQIQKVVFRGRKPTVNMIAEGMQPGAPLAVTLNALGLNADAQEQFRNYAIAQANLGSSAKVDQALRDIQQGKETDLTRKSGLNDSIRARQNELGGAKTRAQSEAGSEGKDALQFGFEKLADVTDTLTDGFRKLNDVTRGASGNALGASPFIGGPISGALGALGGVGGAGFTYQTIRGMLGGARGGRGGVAGRAIGALTGGAQGALDASGIKGTPVFVTNWPGGGFGGGSGGSGSGLGDIADLAEDALGDGEEGEREPGRRGRRGRHSREGRLGRLGRGIGRFGRGAGRGLGGTFGRAATLGRMGGGSLGMGELAGMGGLEAAGAVAAPLIVAAGVGYGLGKGAEHAIHKGWMPGVKSDDEIAAVDHQANLAGKLAQLIGTLRREGYMDVPEAKAEWDRIKPLIHKSSQTRSAKDTADAIAAVEALKGKWGHKARETMGNKGKNSDGSTFHSVYVEGQNTPGRIPETGDGPGGGGGGRGPATTSTLMTMAAGAPAHRITSSVRPGARTVSGGTSYHSSGHAIDIAGSKPGRDSNELLAINKFFAQKYGKGLKELIYAGPGGINLKNGKPHTYSEAVRRIHHDHVHVAATEESLKQVGGVATTGAPDNATSTGTVEPVATSAASPPASAAAAGGGGGVGNFGAVDEQSALASALAPPSLFGNASIPAPRSSGTTKSSASGSTAGTSASGKTAGSSGAPSGPPPGGTVGGWIQQALGMLHLDFAKYGPAIATIIQHESSGNPRAINNWDSNAKAGHPSKGIMQTIDSTFNAHAMPGHTDIWNPVDNIMAATRYALSRYGTLDNVPGIKSLMHGGPYKGYSSGAYDVAEGPAMLHHGEMVVPASTARKVRSMLAMQGSQPQSPVMSMSMGGGGTARPISVSISAPITLAGKATAKDARDFVAMIRDEAQENLTLELMGRG